MADVRAAIVEQAGAEPVIAAVTLAPLRPDEVRVRIVTTGICHTDVAWAAGELWDRFPVILGHEGAGLVEEVGSSVDRVRPGDRVAIGLSHHCGQCSMCESGRPMLCKRRTDGPERIRRNGSGVIQGFGTGAFAEAIVVRQTSTVPIPEGVPWAVAAVVGCAVSTGLGAVTNIASVEYGSRVAILGAGGIGLSVLMGCLLVGAERIVVADPSPERRALALSFGATDAVEPTDAALREASPEGYEFVFESVGKPEAMELAVRATAWGGTVTLIGAAPADAEIRLNALDFVRSQRRLLGCQTGNVRPHLDFERYFRLYLSGRLPLDRLITGTVDLSDLARGFAMSAQGQGVRTMVRISEP